MINVPWFKNVVKRHAEHIGEVYFSWRDLPSGRAPVANKIQQRMENDLREFREMGLDLCLLINGNCYGADAVSAKFADKIKTVVSQIKAKCGNTPAVITTTSPFAAHVVKNEFPEIETRASINMRIGTIEGMTYLKENFDAFYVQREYNRDLEHLSKLKEWADANGKSLHGLLNSGCLNFCSNQTFHDNLVSHESELENNHPLPGFHPVICHEFYANPENAAKFREYGNWIHPADLAMYDEIYATGKLATRMTTDVEKVLAAYATRDFRENPAELLEPRFQSLVDFVAKNTITAQRFKA